MVNLKCYHCQSENIVRNGKTNNGKQRYLCNDCGKMSRDNPQSNGYNPKEREQILAAYQERSSLRGGNIALSELPEILFRGGLKKKNDDARTSRNTCFAESTTNLRTG